MILTIKVKRFYAFYLKKPPFLPLFGKLRRAYTIYSITKARQTQLCRAYHTGFPLFSQLLKRKPAPPAFCRLHTLFINPKTPLRYPAKYSAVFRKENKKAQPFPWFLFRSLPFSRRPALKVRQRKRRTFPQGLKDSLRLVR